MNFGNIEGFVNGTEQVVFDREVSGAAVSSITTGNILNGDEDGWYTIIMSAVADTADSNVLLTFNADTGANYGGLGIRVEDTAASSIAGTALNGIYCDGEGCYRTYRQLTVARMYAKSGAVRLVNMLVHSISSTPSLDSSSYVWNNTADNITSMTFTPQSTMKFAAGTRIIILKSNNFTGGTPTGVITTPYIKGAWVRVGSSVIGSATNSVTFSGLDGDRDVVYYLSAQIKASGACGVVYFRPNTSSTQADFGFQSLYAQAAVLGGERISNNATYTKGVCLGAAGTQNTYNMMASGFFFAKSGFVRPSIIQSVHEVTGTTVVSLNLTGGRWTDTATNITSASFNLETGNFDVGSRFDLYALRPNG